MIKNVIYNKGLVNPPDKFQSSIIMYAENRLQVEIEEGEEIRQYFDWVPFSAFLYVISDLVQGRGISLRPVIKF